jgi:4-carboxymuconolactone decarboxylase
MSDRPSSTDEERFAVGKTLAARLFAGAPRGPKMPSEMSRHTMAHLFGDVWQGDELTVEQRSLLTCAVLVALGREAEQRLHFRGARNLGIPRQHLEGMVIHVAHYAGWPTGATALRILGEVWDAMDEAETD